jgi:translocation and assembly module TamB
MSEMDTLTWLVLGRAPGGLGTDDSALLQRAALALLAGDKNSNSKSFAQRIGLDQLSVHQSDTSTPGSTASGTIVSLGKQISKRLFVGYEHALAAAGGTWDLIYRLAGRFSVQARSGDQNSIDAVWTWRWD